MQEILSVLCKVFYVIAAVYGIYFSIISCFALKKPPRFLETAQMKKFAILIPARNEEACIAGLIESIRRQNYPQELIDIYVIPNHCTDNTAAAAEQAGAKTIDVSETVCSKGQALHEAFARLLQMEDHDAYCVFDADNELNETFLPEMNRALSTARAAKSRILAKNPYDSWVCGCYDLFFCNANFLLNRARSALGLSARLIGTGFAVRRDLMEELGGWNTDTLTEDAEFYACLSAAGERIAFVPRAVTYDEEPVTFRQSLIQRRRWMSGIMEVAKRKFTALITAVICGGSWQAFDCLMQLTFSVFQAWILPVFFINLICGTDNLLLEILRSAAVFYGSSFGVGFVSALFEKRLTGKAIPALLLYPIFVFSFLPLQTLALIAPNRKWKPIAHTGVRLEQSVREKEPR